MCLDVFSARFADTNVSFVAYRIKRIIAVTPQMSPSRPGFRISRTRFPVISSARDETVRSSCTSFVIRVSKCPYRETLSGRRIGGVFIIAAVTPPGNLSASFRVYRSPASRRRLYADTLIKHA